MSRIKISVITLMGFILALCIGLFVAINITSNKISIAAGGSLIIDGEYEDSYELGGEPVEVKTAKFSYDGKEYGATVTVRYPNGVSYVRTNIALTDPGVYYVDYSAIADDGALLKETKTFTVKANVYTFDGEGTAEYGSNDYLEDSVKGVNVSLGRESVFKISKAINISNLTMYDTIMRFYATPSVKGSAEVDRVYVRLTDAYDSSRYVELQYRTVSTFCYVSATANDQYLIGLKQSNGNLTGGVIDYDNYFYVLYHNVAKYGHIARISLNGNVDKTNSDKNRDKYFIKKDEEGKQVKDENGNVVYEYTDQQMFYYNPLEIRMDYTEKRLYCQEDGQYSLSRSLCADLDDERSLGGKSPWEGFTTGEVFISVYASGYSSSKFNFFITDIYGHDILENALVNNIAPVLSVDTQDYEAENLPNAIVNKPYTLFDAFALDDVDGQVSVSKNVFYNYNNSARSMVTVENNAFIPTRAGVYTIEYSATDTFGNKSIKTLNVYAINRDKVSGEHSSVGAEFDAGAEVSVAKLTLTNASNIYGLKIYANNSAQNVEYEIDSDKLKFLPLYIGTYTISYVYTDYCVREVAYSYEITLKSSDNVVFEDNILLPKYIIKGLDYPVKQMYGYTFNGSTQKVLADFYVGEQKVTGDRYKVTGNGSTVDLVYKIKDKQIKYTIPVIDAINDGNIDLAKYFYNEVGKFTATATSSKINFKVDNAVDGTAKLEVINPAYLINSFSIVFNCVENKINFNGIKVVFTGAYNPDKAVTFEFTRDIGDNAKVSVTSANYAVQSSISSKFVGGSNFNVTYNAAKKQFVIGGLGVDVNKVMQDIDDLFYISFELFGITGDASIDIKTVANQKISNSTSDNVKPTAVFDSFRSYYVIGEEINISKIRVYDFIDPNPNCVVSFKNSNGALSSIDGVALNGEDNDFNNEYTVKINGYDELEFQISCTDFTGNSYGFEMPITIKDIFAPSINVDVKNNIYKVGDTVKAAKYTVTDDKTAANKITVTSYIIAPDGSITYLEGGVYIPTQAGIYRVYYIARDEAGNNAYANYQIKVEQGE